MTAQPTFTQAPRIAGALYLAIAVCGGFSIGYLPQAILVSGDSAQTAANLAASAGLFKLGIAADSAVIIFELVLTAILYVLFHKAAPILSATAMLARAGMITVMGMNLLFWVMPLALGTQGDVGQSRMMMFFTAHDVGVYVWQLFFGLHLLALGALILRTGLAPRALGWGLFVGAFGYLLQGIVELTFIDIGPFYSVIIALLVVVTIAELSFALWLLIRGGKRLGVQG